MGTAQDYVLSSFIQREMEREVIATKFAAQACMMMLDPKGKAVNELNANWQKYVNLSYGVDPGDSNYSVEVATEQSMRDEYNRVKDLKLTLKKTDRGLFVSGFPGQDLRKQ